MSLSLRERRVVTTGAWTIVLAFAWRWGADLVEAGLAQYATAGVRAERLAYTTAMAENLPSLEVQVESLRVAYAERTKFLAPVRSVPDAEAHLASSLRAIIVPPRSALARLETLPDSTRVAGLRRVRVRVEMQTDFPGLLMVLGRITRTVPLMRIQSLAVHSAQATPGPGFPEVLRCELVVEGWFRPREGDGP